jgi:tRNA U34 5-carboxymethylaminomethyl modifying GTPase MnmE/TrmE
MEYTNQWKYSHRALIEAMSESDCFPFDNSVDAEHTMTADYRKGKHRAVFGLDQNGNKIYGTFADINLSVKNQKTINSLIHRIWTTAFTEFRNEQNQLISELQNLITSKSNWSVIAAKIKEFPSENIVSDLLSYVTDELIPSYREFFIFLHNVRKKELPENVQLNQKSSQYKIYNKLCEQILSRLNSYHKLLNSINTETELDYLSYKVGLVNRLLGTISGELTHTSDIDEYFTRHEIPPIPEEYYE